MENGYTGEKEGKFVDEVGQRGGERGVGRTQVDGYVDVGLLRITRDFWNHHIFEEFSYGLTDEGWITTTGGVTEDFLETHHS